jgi:hypothetical protein
MALCVGATWQSEYHLFAGRMRQTPLRHELPVVKPQLNSSNADERIATQR